MDIRNFIKDGVIYNNSGEFIWINNSFVKVMDLRGWGYIKNMFKLPNGEDDIKKAQEFTNELGHWIADAINKKIEQESSKLNN